MHVAVVTPAYNDAAFLPECIRSVARARARVPFPVEHVIVDDASTDSTQGVLGRYPHIRTQRLPVNRGCSAALNVAVTMTAAPWLLVLASDDMVTEHAFSAFAVAAHRQPCANVVYSDLELFGTERGLYRTPEFDPALLREKSIIPGASFLRRHLWEATGGFDESLVSAQDWDLWVRADLVAGLAPVKVATPLVRYRYHHAPRLHNESVRNIETIRQVIRSRTIETARLAPVPA